MEDMGAPRAMCAHTSRMVPEMHGTPVSNATPSVATASRILNNADSEELPSPLLLPRKSS